MRHPLARTVSDWINYTPAPQRRVQDDTKGISKILWHRRLDRKVSFAARQNEKTNNGSCKCWKHQRDNHRLGPE